MTEASSVVQRDSSELGPSFWAKASHDCSRFGCWSPSLSTSPAPGHGRRYGSKETYSCVVPIAENTRHHFIHARKFERSRASASRDLFLSDSGPNAQTRQRLHCRQANRKTACVRSRGVCARSPAPSAKQRTTSSGRLIGSQPSPRLIHRARVSPWCSPGATHTLVILGLLYTGSSLSPSSVFADGSWPLRRQLCPTRHRERRSK